MTLVCRLPSLLVALLAVTVTPASFALGASSKGADSAHPSLASQTNATPADALPSPSAELPASDARTDAAVDALPGAIEAGRTTAATLEALGSDGRPVARHMAKSSVSGAAPGKRAAAAVAAGGRATKPAAATKTDILLAAATPGATAAAVGATDGQAARAADGVAGALPAEAGAVPAAGTAAARTAIAADAGAVPALGAAEAGAVAAEAAAAAGTTAGEGPAPQYEPVKQEELYRAALRAVAEGRLPEAAELLERFIAQEPRHAGAFLELAITQCELGNAAEAERLFKTVEERFDPPPGIMEVIASHRAAGCARPTVRPASWLLSAGRGRDSNVNQGASDSTFTIGTGSNQTDLELSPEFLPKADNYNVLTGSYVRPLNTYGTLGIVQGYVRRNDNIHEQDTATVLAGIEHSLNIGRWRTRATAAFGAAMLDKQLYQRQQQLQLRASPPIGLPAGLDFAVAGNISHVAYPTRTAYDATTLELSTLFTYRAKRDQLQFTVSKLRDHGVDARPGGDRSGWFGSLQWYTLLGSGWYAEAGLTHQHWQSDSIYSPGLIEVARRQNLSSGRAAVQWYFRPNVSLHLEGRVVRNRENISLFQYSSHALQLSVRWDNF